VIRENNYVQSYPSWVSFIGDLMNNKPPIKKTWQERVKEVSEFHKRKIRQDRNWAVRDTARELNRSVGSISEDIQLASWIQTHPRLTELSKLSDALDFIRNKKKEMRLR
jgi:hypothetical protein